MTFYSKIKNLYLSIKNRFHFTTFLTMSIFILFFKNPQTCMALAKSGLIQWYQSIIPVLFPFMILTSMIRSLNIDRQLCKQFWFMKYFFRNLSFIGHYIVLLGFACGFPMGAKLVSDYYKQHKLTFDEAQCLLCFCNNISPAFFIGVVCPLLCNILNEYFTENININYMFIKDYLNLILPAFMYIPPLLYGIMLQIGNLSNNLANNTNVDPEASHYHEQEKLTMDLANALEQAINDNVLPIIKIGGYLMIFQVVNIIPNILFSNFRLHNYIFFKALVASLLEITSGVTQLCSCRNIPIAILSGTIFFFLEFGGLSCIMQTYTFISDTDLSIKNYIFHKCMIGLFSALTVICFICIVCR